MCTRAGIPRNLRCDGARVAPAGSEPSMRIRAVLFSLGARDLNDLGDECFLSAFKISAGVAFWTYCLGG